MNLFQNKSNKAIINIFNLDIYFILLKSKVIN